MDKNNWRIKLSSRKFWAGVGAWITATLGSFSVPESTTARVALIISGIGALVVYILTEGSVDAKRAQIAAEEGEASNEKPNQ